MTDASSLQLRPAPAGLPDDRIAPPVIAESGDPFAALRVIALVARIPRGGPVRLQELVDRLNAAHLDWLFTLPVVADVVLQLRANWLADYRNATGIEVEDGPQGATIRVEESPRVDPWIVRQAEREAAACHEALRRFSRQDRATGPD